MDHAPSTLLLLLVVLAAFPALIAGRGGKESPSNFQMYDKEVICWLQEAPSGEDLGEVRRKRCTDHVDSKASNGEEGLDLQGGLAWLGFLTFGVVSEQVKTRTEVKAINEGAIQVDAPEVLLPSGLKVQDLRLGGGDAGCGILGRTSGEKGCGEPRRGDLVTIAFDGLLDDGTSFASQKREISFVYGNRPNEAAGISRGLLEGISTMTQGGVRQITVPADLGFGDKEVETASGVKIPAGSTLRYNVKLKRVSVAPS